MTRRLGRASAWLTGAMAACVLLAAAPAPATGQTRRPPAAPRLELGIGGGLIGGLTLGARDASLVSNNAAGSPFRLFSADTRLKPSALVEGRIGYRLTPRLVAEAELTVARSDLTASLSADAESAPAVEATTRLTEYVVTGGAVWRLSTSARRRWTPFVSAGAGIARHVHAHRVLVETGVESHVGGGLIYALRSRRTTEPRAGLRLDGRLSMLSGGIAEGAGVSPRGMLAGSVFVAF